MLSASCAGGTCAQRFGRAASASATQPQLQAQWLTQASRRTQSALFVSKYNVPLDTHVNGWSIRVDMRRAQAGRVVGGCWIQARLAMVRPCTPCSHSQFTSDTRCSKLSSVQMICLQIVSLSGIVDGQADQ
jgi:hypothetical protein